MEKLLKSFNIRDAIVHLKSSWDELPQSVLVNAWNKIKNWDETVYESQDDMPLSLLFPSNQIYKNTIQEAQTLLKKLAGETILNLEEIENWNEDFIENKDMPEEEAEEETSITDEVDEVEEMVAVPYHDAIESVNKLITWCENNNNLLHLSSLVTLRTEIVKFELNRPKKQVTLINYFKSV